MAKAVVKMNCDFKECTVKLSGNGHFFLWTNSPGISNLETSHSSTTAEIGWRVWGTPANFNGYRVLASLLHRRRSTEVNQTLLGVWPSSAPVHYVYILGGSCPLTELCQVQSSLCVQVSRFPILAALLHGSRAVDEKRKKPQL